MSKSVKNTKHSAATKRILSIDGGGIRGCLTFGYLQKIEGIVRERLDNPEAVLSDYFDLIGGTSTGGLIAAQLALGFDVATVRKNYEVMGPIVFSKPAHWAKYLPLFGSFRNKLYTKWAVQPLEQQIKSVISDKITLGSANIKTGLCIITKRADNFSTWPFINHPDGKFFADNADIPLWKILRASSAAPTFFYPMELDVGLPTKPDLGMFIDGGVSMANNPAMQLFLVATLSGFPYRWPAGEDQLSIVSIGTGSWKRRLEKKSLRKPGNLFWANQVPEMLMQDAGDNVELMMQYLSNSPTNRYSNVEVQDLSNDVLMGKPAFAYTRYNAEIETADDFQKHSENRNQKIIAALGKYDQATIERLREMDNGGNTKELLELGDRFAEEEVVDAHIK